MTLPLCFEDLQSILHQRIDQLPDYRKAGPNTQYRIRDAALGAFGIFFTQSPSFLDYQRTLQQTKGQNNAQTLLGVEQIPCDNQVRKLLDPIAPSHFDPVFVEVFERLEQHRRLAHFRVLGDQLLVAMDGTNYFASKTVHCHNCLTRQLSNGQTLYYLTVAPKMHSSLASRINSASEGIRRPLEPLVAHLCSVAPHQFGSTSGAHDVFLCFQGLSGVDAVYRRDSWLLLRA